MGTSRSSTSQQLLAGRRRRAGCSPSSRSHRSGARSRGSSSSGRCGGGDRTRRRAVATALRSSARISVATGSAVAGSSASMSVISSTPPPSRTVATADATLFSRSSARQRADLGAVEFDQPPVGAHRAHQRRPCRRPPGPDTSTPRLVAGAQCFEQLRLVERELEPFGELGRPAACAPLRSSMLTVADCARRRHRVLARGRRRRSGSTPSPQVTNEFGCTLTGPAGSTPVTVNSSEVQRDADRRRQRARWPPTSRCRAQVARQQRHGVADGHHLAQQGLSQRGRRDRLGGQVRAAQRHRPGAVDGDRRRRSRWCPRAARRWTASRRRAARCRPACPRPATPGHRGGGARTGQRHRVPLPNAKGGNGFRMQSDHAAAGVEAEVFSRAVSRGGSAADPPRRRSASSQRARPAQAEPRHRPAVAAAPGGSRAARRALLSWVCRPTPRGARPASAWLRIANGMWMT